MRSVISKALAAASAEIGTEEVPRGSNWGGRVSEYLRSAGYNNPAYWCAAFTYYVVKQTLDTGCPLPRTGSCDLVLAWARKMEVLHATPQSGDQFLVMASEYDATHTGFVVSVSADGGKTIETIEGNSNNDGSRDGYAVVARKRTVTSRLRFVRWADLVADADADAPTRAWVLCLNEKRLGECQLLGDGANYYPARPLLSAVFGEAEVLQKLTFDVEAQALAWNGKVMDVPVVRRGAGTAYGQVRSMARWMGLDLKVDTKEKRIILAKAALSQPVVT